MSEQQKTILIVDDEQDLAEAMATALKRENFRILIAHNGQEGIDVAKIERPDLIFLDIVMPVKSGIEVLKELRADEDWGKDVHIIVMTVLSDMEKIADVIASGANAHIIKSDLDLFEVVNMAKDKLAEEAE